MKMKAVCEATGLTDRTVRYYIDEELISPAYTENYLGRKTFDFTDSDIRQLKDVAVLRKFGFTVAEIREMLRQPPHIPRIIRELHKRKQSLIHEEQALLRTLSALDAEHTDSVAQLAASLAPPVVNTPIPVEDVTAYCMDLVKQGFKSALIFPIIWFPLAGSIIMFLFCLFHIDMFLYPAIRPKAIFALFLSLSPTVLYHILPRTALSVKWKTVWKRLLILFCLINCLISPILAAGIIYHPGTTDIQHYRKIDKECAANQSDLFHDLFPEWPHYFVYEKQSDGSWNTLYLDAHYLYCFETGWADTCDIYAEWPLEKDAFDQEVARVKEVFEKHAPAEKERSEYRNYVTVQKGPYTCLIIYYGGIPFEKATLSYQYCIFAYDEKTLKVRYIFCDSDDMGYDQPYYLSLDWE